MRKAYSLSPSPSIIPFQQSPLTLPPPSPLSISNAHRSLGVYVCASRDQQRAGLGVAFRSAQVEGSAFVLETRQTTRQTELEGDSHF